MSTSSGVSPEAVLAALFDFADPETGRNLLQQGQVQVVRATGNRIALQLALTSHSAPLWQKTRADVIERLQQKFPGAEVAVELTVHQRPAMKLGQIGLAAKSVVAVGSGKGGVGKSTIAAAIAYGLHQAGCRVGLMDADIYGPSVPHLLGVRERPEVMEVPGPNGQVAKRIKPIQAHGLKVMSMGFLIEEKQAVIFRGPMLHGAITQFLRDTDWGELDYLIIDMPPGTGDIALSLSQLLPLTGAVVVCTPQDVALLDAVKAMSMFRQVKIPVLGMVENMSYFLCPDNGKRYDIFGTGGAKKRAEEENVPFLGEVPINISIRVRGDEGKISGIFEDPESANFLHTICFNLARNIAQRATQAPALPSLPTLS